MNYDYSKRGWLLPDGCKDLHDVLKLEAANLAAAKLQEAWLEWLEPVKHDVAEEAVLPAGFRTAITDVGFVITVCLPGLRSEDVEITVVNNTVRIIVEKAGSYASQAEIHVPSEYRASDARANYLNGELRIVIPKSAA